MRSLSLFLARAAVGLCALISSSAALADSSAGGSTALHAPTPTVLGWSERIKLMPEQLMFDAKLTPGSEGNVLHADDLKEFSRDGDKWVRFSVSDNLGNEKVLERRVIDKSSFRTTSGKLDRRYVIESAVCLEKVYLVLEFALADRSNFDQKVRIGRESLAGNFIIDPARTRTSAPDCSKSKRKSR